MSLLLYELPKLRSHGPRPLHSERLASGAESARRTAFWLGELPRGSGDSMV